MTLSSDRDKMVGRLPQAKIGGYPAGEYSLLRQDDKIAVSIKGVEIPLNKWFDTKEETG